MCVDNSHRQVPANKARSVLPQVQRGRQEKEVNEEGGREGGRKGKKGEEGVRGPLIPSNIPSDDRGRPKERR